MIKNVWTVAFIQILMLAYSNILPGQINSPDSSVQVVPQWNLGETNSYEISYQQLTYFYEDTLSDVLITYEIDITVIDSTEDSFTVRWQNKNFNILPFNAALKALYDAANKAPVDVKISRLGVFEEVLNWKEVKDSTNKYFKKVARQVRRDPEANFSMKAMKAAISSKKSIESDWIPNVHQFHMFHGSKYILNKEVTGKVLTPNYYNEAEPFDTYVTVILEKINDEFKNYTIRSYLEIDTEQLTNSTYNYLSDLMDYKGQNIVDRSEFSDVSTVIETVTIFHDSGWVIDSTQWKANTSDETTTMQIRRIRFK